MARLIYSAITSLDGYVADEQGIFDWAEPDEEVHRLVNDVEREVGTYLYGRRMYEVLSAWDRPELAEGQPEVIQDYSRLWRAADKVVYSTTLDEVWTPRTRLERRFDPDAVRQLTQQADRDLSVGGPELAAHAIRAGLVDDYHVFLNPVVVGGGQPWLPHGVRVDLELLDQRRFRSGVTHLHYRTRPRRE
jgi:dihydrofolate reductase